MVINSKRISSIGDTACTRDNTRDKLNNKIISVIRSISLIVLIFNFSKEQYVPPEDDGRIETCRSVLSVLM